MFMDYSLEDFVWRHVILVCAKDLSATEELRSKK